MDVICRPATARDVPAIATVRIRSWQAGYRGLMPPDYLDALDPAAEAERWRGRDLTGQHVAESDGVVVAWLAVGAYRADPGEDVPGPDCGRSCSGSSRATTGPAGSTPRPASRRTARSSPTRSAG